MFGATAFGVPAFGGGLPWWVLFAGPEFLVALVTVLHTEDLSAITSLGSGDVTVL
jgi:hypothetical protein